MMFCSVLAACTQAPAAPTAMPHVPAMPVPAQLAPRVVQTPITWTAEREALTVAYRRAHQAQSPETSTIAPQVIVLHWTGSDTFRSAFATFDTVALTGRQELQGAGALNVSAHFLVDQDGTIHQLLPVTTMARHVIGLNHVAIGVENVGGTPRTPLTDAQVTANVALVRWLDSEHPIEVLIGHHEYRQLEGTEWFDERDDSYRTTKIDPGAEFMTRVRAELTDLALQP